MAINAVEADVQLPALEPRAAAAEQVALLHAGPGFAPVEKSLGLLGPENFWLFDRLLVKAQVVVVVQVSALTHGIGYGVVADLEHGGSLLLFRDVH